MISVIVPVYNAKQYLRQCVESILCNDTACEILLIDDGSTDGVTGDFCDQLSVEHPAVVRSIHQQNRGPGGARNTGVQEARGDYLLFVDSDDALVPGTLDQLQSWIDRNPNGDIFSFDLMIADEKGVHLSDKMYAFTAKEPFTLDQRPEYLLVIASVCCRLWRRTLFTENKICFPDRVRYGEDLRTVAKLSPLAKEIVWIGEAFYIYYQRVGSVMHATALERNREMIEAFDDILSWYRAQGLFPHYEETLMLLCAEHLYLAASVRVLREDSKHPLLKELANYMDTQFPNHRKAKYENWPKSRKLVYTLLNLRQYKVIALLFKMRGREV